ncbi:MAG: VanZ family protein [Patescibacteria group bacterium]
MKRFIPAFILVAYSALLIKVMVFKDLPTIRIGQLMLNFAGTDAGHAPNFVPFKTILPYLLGFKGWIIAGVNLVGNIVLLVPIGFLLPFLYPNITWKKSLAIAIASGLAIETMQTLLRVGIFDIDDVILNALGVMIGYFATLVLTKWMRERKYMHMLIAAFIGIAAAAGALYAIYPHGQPVIRPEGGGQFNSEEGRDLCGGTGGTGQIVSVGNNGFTIERRDGSNQIVNLADKATIETPAGPVSTSDLKIGDRVTLVGDVNPDGSFTADTVVVCSTPVEREE